MPESGSLSDELLEQSTACLWMVGEDLVFHRVYGPSNAVLGKPAEELKGHCAREALDAESSKTWCGRFVRALAGETLYLRERSGDSTWYISVYPVLTKDGRRYAGALAREMTPWKTAEQELRNTVLSALKSQEFERNTLSKFLHDQVGQNLTALGLQLDLARMDLESRLAGHLHAHRRNPEGAGSHHGGGAGIQLRTSIPRRWSGPACGRARTGSSARIRERFPGGCGSMSTPPEDRPEDRRGHVSYRAGSRGERRATFQLLFH